MSTTGSEGDGRGLQRDAAGQDQERRHRHARRRDRGGARVDRLGGPLTSGAIDDLGGPDYCYLTTVGRVSGDLHEIEIWFALNDGVLYMLSGDADRSDWVRNVRANPDVRIRVGTETRSAFARVVTEPDEDTLARSLLLEKYRPRYSGELDGWGRTSLPVAVEWAHGSVV